MRRIGSIVPGGSFMPQGVGDIVSDMKQELLNGYKTVIDSGYDYMEATVGMVMKLSEREVYELREDSITIEICNSFIPPEYSLISPDEKLYSFLKEAFMKMKLMGVDTVVLGSGKSRSIPDEISIQEGIYKLKEFFKRCNEFAQKSDITVAIEPLNVDETNVIHTVSEGAELVRDIDCSHIKLLADVYHMYRSDEDMKVLSENKDILKHIHVCHAEKRAAVKDFSSEYLKMFAKALDEMNYKGRVSLECQFDNFEEECKNSYEILRELF